MNTIEGKDRQKISKAMRQHGRINPQDREIPKTAAKVPVRFSEADQKKKKKKKKSSHAIRSICFIHCHLHYFHLNIMDVLK